MAFHLNLFLWALCSAGAALAQSADPTRPPPAFIGAAGTVAGGGAEPVGNRLTSVVIARQGSRSRAVIDGQVLRRGDRIGDSRLIRITETQVELAGPNGRETLYLTPGIGKTRVVDKTVRQRKKETP